MKPVDFIAELRWDDLPQPVRAQTKLALLDLIGVAIGGSATPLSAIIRDHAIESFGGDHPMLMDGRKASCAGVALAAGMTIDALDGHDGFNPAKGHIGCPLFAAIFPFLRERSGKAALTTLAMGYEFGARASVAQHATVPDYHTSGSWGAVTGAAAVARLIGLSREQTRHALGIAEYHGPRSQMMRCIDHPTMLKDGSGWGAMTAVSAAQLAARGFTGAPALTIEDAPDHWADLGQRWFGLEQYYKPYPVCRWAQPPVEAILSLRATNGLRSQDVARIEVETFHESTRLATARPRNTEEAQYSTSFPSAVAMVHGTIRPEHLSGAYLQEPETLRLSSSMTFAESETANAAFPHRRLARVRLHLSSGKTLESDWHEPKWDATAPPSGAELRAKFHDLADPAVGPDRATEIEALVMALEDGPFEPLHALLAQPINR